MSAHPDIEDAHKVMCARRSPEGVDVEAGKYYFWCACGRSKTQPFCDGSHRPTKIKPVEYKAEKTGKVFFCMCKQTGGRPICDGTHEHVARDAEGRLLSYRPAPTSSGQPDASDPLLVHRPLPSSALLRCNDPFLTTKTGKGRPKIVTHPRFRASQSIYLIFHSLADAAAFHNGSFTRLHPRVACMLMLSCPYTHTASYCVFGVLCVCLAAALGGCWRYFV
jgi:CDGSH-type Zn-finger protein